MANFDNDAAGRATAEALVITRMASGAWLVGHMAMSKAGDTIVRFIRPAAPTDATTKEYGGWTESRADDEP